jgi:glycosyltransferase involved in cell wall biosynthesis
VVVNCSPGELFDLCLAKLMLPFSRGRIVSLDTVLPVPYADSLPARLKLGLKKVLFQQCHLFIEYFRQTEGYERHYGIPRDRFRYVPFKINRYERVINTPTRDDGYVFCGGNTRRDFQTLVEAVGHLPIPVKIVTMPDSVIAGHGSVLNEQHLPPNIEVIRHDGTDTFLDYIAAARLVALPIRRENISASGIGVYLASMALGKCVVISEGPAVNGVVPPGAAVIVPPEDPQALRAAIERMYADDEARRSVAAAGQAYALGLGGEERLCASVADVLIADCSHTER